uniref:Uncharacterized protein n=1 Tax=Rhizophora mucronata TaxID=61149 RepID=A0A2P2P040_RHIMU
MLVRHEILYWLIWHEPLNFKV